MVEVDRQLQVTAALSLQTEAILRSYYVSYIVVNTYNNIDEV